MPDLFLPPSGRQPRRRRRGRVVAITIAGLFALAAAGLGALALTELGTIPAGTTIAGVDVGGMTRGEAIAALEPATDARLGKSIRLIGPRGEARLTGRELGARPLLEPALAVALAADARERLLRRLGIGTAQKIPLSYRLGPIRAAELANRLDRQFGRAPRDAGISVEPTGVSVSAPAPGTVVDRATLRQGLRTLPAELGVPLRDQPPSIGIEAARVAQLRVMRLLDGPREVRFRDRSAVLPPATLGPLVTTAPVAERLRVALDAAALRTALLPFLGRFERLPVSARSGSTRQSSAGA